jgi:hypothetical protein
MTDAIEYRQTAIKLYEDYLAIQEKIAAIEIEALKAAQNDSRAAGVILLNRPDTEQGYLYLSLCKERDQLMKRAELAATMAMMLSVVQ